jgi:hypothetical protein
MKRSQEFFLEEKVDKAMSLEALDDDDWEPAPGEHPTWSMDEIDNHPLFMSDGPLDENNPHVQALQSVLYDYESENGAAMNFKNQGNDALRRGLVDDAGVFYENGIMSGCKDKDLLSQLHSNLALIRLKQERYPECVDECYRAIGHDASNSKAFLRGAMASMKLDLYSQGIYFAKGGLDADGENTELKQLLEEIERAKKAQLEAKKKESESSVTRGPKLKFRWRD